MASRQISSVENEMQSNFLRMSDADRLVTCKRNVLDAEAAGLAGGALESLVAGILGLVKAGKKDPQGTVKTMYVYSRSHFSVRITMSRMDETNFNLMIEIMRR